jgi:hypothetical protein
MYFLGLFVSTFFFGWPGEKPSHSQECELFLPFPLLSLYRIRKTKKGRYVPYLISEINTKYR